MIIILHIYRYEITKSINVVTIQLSVVSLPPVLAGTHQSPGISLRFAVSSAAEDEAQEDQHLASLEILISLWYEFLLPEVNHMRTNLQKTNDRHIHTIHTHHSQ